ncbi:MULTISPECIES: hypothetical protein [Burkholderia]
MAYSSVSAASIRIFARARYPHASRCSRTRHLR